MELANLYIAANYNEVSKALQYTVRQAEVNKVLDYIVKHDELSYQTLALQCK